MDSLVDRLLAYKLKSLGFDLHELYVFFLLCNGFIVNSN